VDLAGFKAGALGFHPGQLVTFWLDADGKRYAGCGIRLEFLNEVKTRTGLFDQDPVGSVLTCEIDQLAL
jgi:hypothetical protein